MMFLFLAKSQPECFYKLGSYKKTCREHIQGTMVLVAYKEHVFLIFSIINI